MDPGRDVKRRVRYTPNACLSAFVFHAVVAYQSSTELSYYTSSNWSMMSLSSKLDLRDSNFSRSGPMQARIVGTDGHTGGLG